MKEISETDWCLQALVCQVLWNYSEKITTSVACFGEEETDDLITILNEYLGKVYFYYTKSKYWCDYIRDFLACGMGW